MSPSHRSTAAVFGALIAVAAAMGFGRFAFTQLLAPMVAQLHLSALAVSWLAAVNYAGYLAGALAAVALCNRYNERRVALAGLLALTLTLVVTPLWGSLWWLAAARFAAGVESAVIFIAVGILVFETMRRTTAMIAFGGVGVGIFVSAALLAPLVAHGPWQRGWYLTAAMSLASTVIAWSVIPPVSSRASSGITIPRGLALRLVDAAYFLQGVGYIVFATFAVLYLLERGTSHAVASGAWLAVGAGASIGPWLSGVVAARIGPRRALMLFHVVEALATLLFALGPPPLTIVAALVFGTSFPTAAPLCTSMYVDLAPDEGARGLGWLTFVFAIGQIAGPLIAGPIAQRTGEFRIPLLLSAAALFVAAALASAARRPRAAGPSGHPCEASAG